MIVLPSTRSNTLRNNCSRPTAPRSSPEDRAMTLRPLSRAEVRSIDARAAEELGLPTLVLMENAGRGAAERLRARLREGDRVALACGPGNNGGDGGVVARHLDAWGHPVRVVWFADPAGLRGDAATQHSILA